MHFEWRRAKAESNRRKHKVTFDEAVSVFYDPLSATFPDPDSPSTEQRLVTVGQSSQDRLLVVVHTEQDETIRLSVHGWLQRMSANGMKAKRTNEVAQMRAEYDFDYSKAVRGKYYKRLLKEGSNVVILDRDVAKAFPDSASVNKALRSVLKSKRPRRPTARSTRTRDKASRAG